MSHKLTTLAQLPGLSISGTAQAGNTLAFCESPNETRLSNQSLISRLCFAVICAIVFLVPNMVNATTIGFDGLSGNENGSSFSTYTESGFTVQPVSGDWLVRTMYGNPSPFIFFSSTQEQQPLSAGISVTNGGSAFQFSSVDLYSSMTTIPYTFSGFLNSMVVFTETGTVPNTFGGFATVLNQYSSSFIDALEITLVNPAGWCCGSNPVGLDNVVLLETTVPEPTILSLLFVGLVSLVLQKRRNKKVFTSR